MASNYLITGYWGEPHVTAENDRGIHAALFGTGRFVLPVGEQFRAEYIGNNTVRIYDGKLMDNGAAAGIPVGEYVDLQISNAGQGMNRNDLIVFQYSQDASTLVESGTFVVLQGAEVSGSASDPELTQADLLSGEATFDQMAMWRISVSGTAISAPVQMFTVYENPGSHIANKDNPHGVTAAQVGASETGHKHSAEDVTSGTFGVARGGTGKATHTANAVLTGNGTSAVNNVATASGALYATASNGAAKFGTLPVAQGGTGATTVVDAVDALGALNLKNIEDDDHLIASGDDLNDYTTPGTYRCATTAIASSLLNKTPYTSAGFRLLVSSLSTNTSRIQLAIFNAGQSRVYYRHLTSSGTWTPWTRMLTDVLNENSEYGDSLPAAGTKGRIFFKKVDG